MYCSEHKCLDRQSWANSADTGQTAPRALFAIPMALHISRYHTILKPLRLNFRVFTIKLVSAQTVCNFTIDVHWKKGLVGNSLPAHLPIGPIFSV